MTYSPCHLCGQYKCMCFQGYGRVELRPKGCICPPGAEKTCRAEDCPRKSMSDRITAMNPSISLKCDEKQDEKSDG